MRKLARRIASVAFVIATVAAIVPAASVSAWNTECSSSIRICLWRDGLPGQPAFSGHKATTDVNKDDYSGQPPYPGTSITVNDSVSSIKNKFVDEDVRFYWNAGPSTIAFCLPQNTNNSGVAEPENDDLSAHKKGDWC